MLGIKKLILTGHSDTWPKDPREYAFLGSWCFTDNPQIRFWESEHLNLTSSPWSSTKDLAAHQAYIDELTDRLTQPLADYLNQFQKTPHKKGYWDVLIAITMSHLLATLYDRYLRLKHLSEKNVIYDVEIVNQWTQQSSDVLDFILKSTTHGYNLELLSKMLRLLNFKNFNLKPITLTKKNIAEAVPKTMSAKGFRYLAHSAANFSPVWLRHVKGLSFTDKLRIQLSSGAKLRLPKKNWVKVVQFQKPKNLENECLPIFDPKNEFEILLSEILLSNLPDFLFCSFEVNLNNETIIGPDPFVLDDLLFCATLKELGRGWVSVQHGGGYGQFSSFPFAKFEYELSGNFVTWGWSHKHKVNSNFTPLPSPFLSKIKPGSPQNDQIILLGTQYPAYLYRLHSWVLPEQRLEYLKQKKYFFESLNDNNKKRLKYKLYPVDYGIKEREYMNHVFNDENKITSLSAAELMRTHALVVMDHPGTLLAEALSANIPFVCFWNASHFDLIPEVESIMEKFRSAGILHPDGETAAKFINKISGNIPAFWSSPSVQKAISEYSRLHAVSSKTYIKDWSRFVNQVPKIINDAQKVKTSNRASN